MLYDQRMIKLLIVDDHAIVREGLRTLLAETPGLEIVGEAVDGPSAVTQAQALRPDVILLDLMLPGLTGIEVTERVRQSLPECRILLLTSFAEDQNVVAAIQAGAAGYLLKDVLQAETELEQSRFQHEQALLSFWTAQADLEKALGEEK